ncbi:MAG: phage tail protein [Bacteroidia bacterium]|nr:phage tail protein [Bacteroidia bacterium]
MSLSKSDIISTYPLPVYNYKVTIIGDSSVDISFTEVSGLTIEYETHTYIESATTGVGPTRLYMPAQIKPVNISLKKGMIQSANLTYLYDWIKESQFNQISKRDVIVSLCDENGAPVVTWTVINAFPTKLDAPTFDASSNDAAIQSMDLMADRVEIK